MYGRMIMMICGEIRVNIHRLEGTPYLSGFRFKPGLKPGFGFRARAKPKPDLRKSK
jgi:hypothetical protein